ncbi:SDR family NAD(P)-dependent oxidoreductase [Mucilaginibacter sp. P25]|uniref:NAD(P)-dependent dehydrogenase, short-chain alcohol dehydrogenase family n=1 Tax=Mucilaginibacter gossypii TaxID=551996 RepID=A0A1G8F079_9SPHI|nr:SDR family NAD(P)-dependent oxidoreductase [Mucilaginibacter gossypii]SDH75526.1 NAD(P)-dependent dehydrogenase, short-chain alcohol dehydrogenase family [Mucilaginibacter gossypii]
MTNSIKKVLVTGASNGIGFDLTKKLLAEGAEVIAVTRTGKVGEYSHPNLKVYQGDISNAESIEKVAQQLEEAGIKLDVLVNNAGVGLDLGDEVPTADLLNATFATNTTGTVLFTEALLNSLNDGGQIVFLSTAMALLRNAAPNAPAYRMSKAALNMYAVMLSQRLAERKIRVTPLHPGWVQTRMGGDTAPVTVERSVNGIFKAITENTETGKFWNIELDTLEDY